MKNGRSWKQTNLMLLLIAALLILPSPAQAAGAMVKNVREGLHTEYTRIVFDCSGEQPKRIGPAETDFIAMQFSSVRILPVLNQISDALRGGVERIEAVESTAATEIRLVFRSPNARTKTLVMPPADDSESGYRLVVDVYNRPAVAQQPNAAAAAATTVAAVSTPAIASSTVAAPATTATAPVVEPMIAASAAESPESNEAPVSVDAGETTTQQAQNEQSGSIDSDEEPDSEEAGWAISGEASLILRSDDVDGSTAQFDKYGDRTSPVSGDVEIDAEKNREYYLHGKATRIGQDDQFVGAEAGRYGKYGIDVSWDKIIHRYASDARTLYSGVGSATMTLDDALQADIQSAPTAAEVASRLQGYMPSAAVGDPEITRDKRKIGFDLLALDPLTLRIDLANEQREGTRPFAGAFNNSQMVELFQPVEYDTTEMRISAEYAQAPFMLNAAYQYSQFKNEIDTLSFDNPLRLTDDAVAGSSSGRMDLAPDNQYHNFALSGALTQLPWRSQIVANAAWSRMTQDDALVPFTSNSAITAPALPADRVDAQINTALYNFRVTSRPMPYLRLKGFLRHYDYDNRTGVIDLSGGYVETDETLVATAVRNLPTSYTKTRTGGEIGFDVFARSNLNLGYTYEKTERENREVAEQEDHIMKAALDTRALDWMDIRTSYTRTQRDIGEYRYDIYLESGQDLQQLPQLRKYDQADLTRDLVQFLATVYPTEALALSGSISYGTDDFTDSPYGLVEDSRYVFSFDADYAVGDRLSLNLFYTHEIYENEQRAQQNGGATDFDWQANGKDLVDTLGGGLKLALIPGHLDLDLTYAYSDVDGNLEFYSPTAAFADFSAVDDSKTHMLDSKLTYHNALGFDISVGYLWEKFDYSDFAADGFTYVPTDNAGNYQGALLSGTLPQDYDAHVIYTRFTIRYH